MGLNKENRRNFLTNSQRKPDENPGRISERIFGGSFEGIHRPTYEGVFGGAWWNTWRNPRANFQRYSKTHIFLMNFRGLKGFLKGASEKNLRSSPEHLKMLLKKFSYMNS